MATVKKGSKAAKAKMAKVRAARAKKAPKKAAKKTAFKEERQIPVNWTNSGGYLYRYNKQADIKRKNALPPGQRISKNGNVYYEYRVNRSDKTGSLTGNTISGINGAINQGKKVLLDNLHYLYGRYASDFIRAKTLKEKRYIKKLMSEIKKEINKLK